MLAMTKCKLDAEIQFAEAALKVIDCVEYAPLLAEQNRVSRSMMQQVFSGHCLVRQADDV